MIKSSVEGRPLHLTLFGEQHMSQALSLGTSQADRISS